MRHFLTLNDVSRDEILEILELAHKIKQETKQKIFHPYLQNQTLGMIFEKSSTRTRVSFEVGMYQLGGSALFLSSKDIQLGRGEPVSDTARVISSMVDMIMIRTFEHSKIEEFASLSKVPVINGLTDDFHPVQLMADMMTIQECGLDKNLKVAYIGDGNNMTHSWILMAQQLGFELSIATPKGYEPKESILQKALQKGAKIQCYEDPQSAVKDAAVVTTDTWISMGQEEEKEKRIRDFRGFIVDENLMSLADSRAIFLHCLPAYREHEVSSTVFEGIQSKVWQEAENRLHVQKAIMVWCDGKR